MFGADWLEIERQVWAPPEQLTPSEWAERHRELTRKQSERIGRLSHANAPYLVGIMDIGSERELARWPAARRIEELYVPKPAQVGVSEAIRSVIGHAAERDPDPLLLVLPGEKKGREIVRDRILPLFQDTPILQKLIGPKKKDTTMDHVELRNGFMLYLGFSGSPASLASNPMRRVILDEVDKFKDWDGKEGDPISLARTRMRTYTRNRMCYALSTPTTRAGYIWTLAEAATIQLHYLVPCPHCGLLQPMTFDRLKWRPREELPHKEFIGWLEEQEDAVWYECKHCEKRIDEQHKPGLSAAGVWALREFDGRAVDTLSVSPARICYEGWPAGRRAAMFVDPFYCLWIRWREIAAGFLRARGDRGALMEWTNQTLGKVFELEIERPQADTFSAKSSAGGPDRKTPEWARRLLMTVDCQKDHYWYVVRAFGPGFRSRRVDHGMVATLADALKIAQYTYPNEKEGLPGLRCALVGIDAGYRPYEVYKLSLRSPLIKAMKGEGKPRFVPPRASRVTYTPPAETGRGPISAFLHLWYTDYYKDLLSARINSTIDTPTGDAPLWELSDRDDAEYNGQMCGEHRILVKKAGRFVETWKKVAENAPNHMWDCEAMLTALAEIARVDLLTEEQPRAWKERVADRRRF